MTKADYAASGSVPGIAVIAVAGLLLTGCSEPEYSAYSIRDRAEIVRVCARREVLRDPQTGIEYVTFGAGVRRLAPGVTADEVCSGADQ